MYLLKQAFHLECVFDLLKHFLKLSPVFNNYIGQRFLEEPNKWSHCSQESLYSLTIL